MKNIFINLNSKFKKVFSNILNKYQNDKFGLILFLLASVIISVTLVTLPIFTHNEGLTFITNILSIVSIFLIFVYLFLRGKLILNYYVIFISLFMLYAVLITLMTTKDFAFTKTLLTTHFFGISLFLFFSSEDNTKLFFVSIFLSFFIYFLYFAIAYFPIILKNFSSFDRLGDKLGNVNNVGITFNYGIIFCLAYAYSHKGKALLLFIPAILFAFCLICTGSRGAYVNTGIMVILFLYLFFGKNNWLEFILALITFVSLLVLILQIPSLENFRKRLLVLFSSLFTLGTSEASDASSITRINMFLDGISLWTKNLFFGFGIGGFKANTSYPYYSHNTISELLVDTGIIGAVLYSFPFFKTVYLNLKHNRNKNHFILFIAIFVSSIISLFSEILFYSKIAILIWSLLCVFTYVYTKEKMYSIEIKFFDGKKLKVSALVNKPKKEEDKEELVKEQIKPNIVFILTRLYGGGAERVASILCSEWSKEHNVTLILTSNNQLEENNYSISKNVNVKYLSKTKKISLFKKIYLIRKILKENKSNICVTFLANSFILGKLASIGLKIHHIFSIRIDPKQKTKKMFEKKIAYKYSEAIVCQTEEIDDYFNKKRYTKSLIIKNPVSNNISPSKNNAKNFIAIGRLTSQKNFDFLIDAFDLFTIQNSDATFTIYGSGDLEKHLKEKVKTLKLESRVQILPFEKNIVDKLTSAGIYLSSAIYEGFSNSMLEAALAGLPIVSLDCGGGCAKELINNGETGYILPLNCSPKEFCNDLNKIYSNYNFYRNNAIKNSKNLKEKFDSKTIADEWIDLFNYILN